MLVFGVLFDAGQNMFSTYKFFQSSLKLHNRANYHLLQIASGSFYGLLDDIVSIFVTHSLHQYLWLA